jgi:hypothetical protein
VSGFAFDVSRFPHIRQKDLWGTRRPRFGCATQVMTGGIACPTQTGNPGWRASGLHYKNPVVTGVRASGMGFR